MTTTTETTMEKKNDTDASTTNAVDANTATITGVVDTGTARGSARDGARPPRRQRPRRSRNSRDDRARSEFDQMTIDVRRVARVVAGGRRFSFSVTVVIGDRKGRVGVGLGKGTDTALAIEKANRDARRHLIQIPRTKSGSILHEASAKYTSSCITIAPSPGRGIVAGSAMRIVIELSGVTDVVGKILSRSKNKLTITRATVRALASVRAERVSAKTSVDTQKSKESSQQVQSVVS